MNDKQNQFQWCFPRLRMVKSRICTKRPESAAPPPHSMFEEGGMSDQKEPKESMDNYGVWKSFGTCWYLTKVRVKHAVTARTFKAAAAAAPRNALLVLRQKPCRRGRICLRFTRTSSCPQVSLTESPWKCHTSLFDSLFSLIEKHKAFIFKRANPTHLKCMVAPALNMVWKFLT